LNLGYSIVSEKEADIYDPIGVSELTRALDVEDCTILSISEQSESLENYFVSLVGGESHE
ncbi:MAG: ABC transporter ATP-binding protein, partial [Oscillospiraceae bacterium]|nr:ABC transporter ATP-binding protein [Oscillospiraceae bacterium]